MSSGSRANDGVITVPGTMRCADVERAAAPWLFSADTPELTVAEWIDRGGGDLLWELLGPTRAQVLGIAAELPDGSLARFGGRVVKNVAGYDLARAFVGAHGELGRIEEAHLRLRPPPRGWRAAGRRETGHDEALKGPGCAVWDGGTTRFLRLGERTPDGYEALDPVAARARLRERWASVLSFLPWQENAGGGGAGAGILLAGPRMVGSENPPTRRTGALWERLVNAWR